MKKFFTWIAEKLLGDQLDRLINALGGE